MRFGWKMESTTETSGGVSSTQAVLLGALAPGVNGPTWITLKLTFLMMGMCLAVMLGLAFSSSDSPLLLHVTFLVLICVTLFLLLSWFLAQTGLVTVEHQMREMGILNLTKDFARNIEAEDVACVNDSWLTNPYVSHSLV
ncbi:hypothetical protein AHAS_Ahas10G0022600 [Arachis hypogaea]